MLRMLLFTVVFGCIVHAADVSGKWIGEMPSGNTVGNPTTRVFLNVHRNGDVISGTLALREETRQVKIERPAIHGELLTFEVHDNPTRIITFSLTISGDLLSGDATSGERRIKIALTRQN